MTLLKSLFKFDFKYKYSLIDYFSVKLDKKLFVIINLIIST